MRTYRRQKRVLGALELELQAILSPMIWVLGTNPGYSASTEVILTTEPSLSALI